MLTSLAAVTGVGQCVLDELEDSLGGLPNRACLLVPGEIAWDECDCGQFAQTITGDVPSSAFPTPAADQRASPCGPALLVVTVTASLVRCVPTLSDNGVAPTCDALLEAARIQEDDRVRLRRAVVCCLREMRRRLDVVEFSVGATSTVGPQGMCGGVELTYQFAVGNVCCG